VCELAGEKQHVLALLRRHCMQSRAVI